MSEAQVGRDFWVSYQPGLRFTSAPPGSAAFFQEVEAHRYQLEPHIPRIVSFDRWAGRDVLEVGCGIATDGARFARAGARYTGVDRSATAISLARQRFEIDRLEGRFVEAALHSLPFEDESFDLVYSHGVIHHSPATERAVDEFHRVLRPGGTAIVMVYHRRSLNYYLNIMTVRRLAAATLWLPGAGRMLERALPADAELVGAYRSLLRRHGLRYLVDRELFLSNNTDGPGNPLSKVYTRASAARLFERFADVRTATRYLNLRLYPGGQRLASTAVARALERRLGWHLYVVARKASG